MNNRKNSRFGVGLIVGIAAGALAGIFMAPKSGKENRKMAAKKLKELKEKLESGELEEQVRKTFGDTTDQLTKFYQDTRTEVLKRMNEMGENMNANDYVQMVKDVITKAREKQGVSEKEAHKMQKYLEEEYEDEKSGKKKYTEKNG